MDKTEIRVDRLLLLVPVGILEQVTKEDSPFLATEIISRYSHQEAVSIIDNLDPLTAVFVINTFEMRASGMCASVEGSDDVDEAVVYARELLSMAHKLHIRGTRGLCHARDEVYRKTGFFVA